MGGLCAWQPESWRGLLGVWGGGVSQKNRQEVVAWGWELKSEAASLTAPAAPRNAACGVLGWEGWKWGEVG